MVCWCLRFWIGLSRLYFEIVSKRRQKRPAKIGTLFLASEMLVPTYSAVKYCNSGGGGGGG